MMEPTVFTIQEVSDLTDLPNSTLRYYEEIGLLEPVTRASNGHRRYSEADLQRIELVKKLRLTGMALETMQAFVALYRDGSATAGQRRAKARAELLASRMDFSIHAEAAE